MRNTASPPKSHRLLQRTVLAFAAVGTVLVVATVIIVYRIMAGFRDELLQRPGAADDQMLLEAIARESNTMVLVLTAVVLVATLNIAAGFLMLRRSQPGRAGQGR
jgi:ABC-type lipoprotein release transport system permease subunit